MPASHREQKPSLEAPFTPAYFPTGQFRHVELLSAPDAVEYVPGRHNKHEAGVSAPLPVE